MKLLPDNIKVICYCGYVFQRRFVLATAISAYYVIESF